MLCLYCSTSLKILLVGPSTPPIYWYLEFDLLFSIDILLHDVFVGLLMRVCIHILILSRFKWIWHTIIWKSRSNYLRKCSGRSIIIKWTIFAIIHLKHFRNNIILFRILIFVWNGFWYIMYAYQK